MIENNECEIHQQCTAVAFAVELPTGDHVDNMFFLAGLLPAHKSNDIVEVAHMLDATEDRGVGVGWGVMTSLKLHTC